MNIARDVNENVPLKTSLKNNLVKSVKNVGKRVMRGGRLRKRVRKVTSGKKSKRKKKAIRRGKCHVKKKDIFANKMLEF